MTDKQEKDSLEELIPQTNAVVVQPYNETEAETLLIRPFTFGQLPRVLRHIYALMRFITPGEDGTLTMDSFNVKDMFLLGGEDVIQVLAVAAGKAREWFDQLPADQGIELLAVVVNENADFFVNHVMPNLQVLTGRLSSATNLNKPAGTGQTS